VHAAWLRVLILLIAAVPAVYAQALEFEAATIKPAEPGAVNGRVDRDMSPGRMAWRNMTLRDLIYQAWGTGLSTSMKVIGGPAWIARDRFSIEAVAQGKPNDRQFRIMLRTLLEERFAVRTHMETEQIDVFALLLDRPGAKLGKNIKPWDGTCSNGNPPRDYDDPAMPRCTGAFRPPGLVLEGVTMVPLAEMLSTQRPLLGRIVQDRTGLTGRYNISLEYDFAGANRPDYSGPSIFTAVKEQLGLRLEGTKGPLQVLVVDSANPPGAN
jgi:uncharacterized protein (TIGR03435 family)